jgi:hypothetical protein
MNQSIKKYPLPITAFSKKGSPPIGSHDPISRKSERCYRNGLYGDKRYRPAGMLPAVVSLLEKNI